MSLQGKDITKENYQAMVEANAIDVPQVGRCAALRARAQQRARVCVCVRACSMSHDMA